jgi:hypothetical protein
MKRTQRWWWLALLVLPLFAALASAALLKMTVSSTSVKMLVGSQTSVQIYNAQGTVRVTSSNTNVAVAEISDGQVKIAAKARGTARLTVKDRYTTIYIYLTVSYPPITVSPQSVSLARGQTTTVTLGNARGTVSASSANTAIATASISSGNLRITAKAAGATTITVKDAYSSAKVAVTVSTTASTSASYTLLAWNDLGMHCMDGDYSVFSILPPYNNLHAQVIDSSNNKLVTSGVTLTYEAMADATGSINSISSTKTNFWTYIADFFNVVLPGDMGLAGNKTASTTPQPLKYDTATRQFVAEGIPITPLDDAFRKNPYPMVKVVARDGTGKQLAQARVVLPVSDEMSCASCHASNTGTAAAKPAAGWVNGVGEPDWKRNILRLHDEKQAGNSAFTNALATKGYNPAGLLATSDGGKAILCASCHLSNALPGTGVAGIKPLTEAIHRHHATVKDTSGNMLDSITNRSSCYQCHPGSETKCLRGVMGEAKTADGKLAIDCQSCHGTMSNVGRAGRTGWLDQPTCQSCHHDGQRELTAVSSTGILKTWLDTRFASNPNAPASGFSLYRFSSGHGGLQCEACHGATHAEYPSSHANDNVLSTDVQGHAGTIGECSACHKNQSLTATGGPHGMHSIGSAWVSGHESYAENNRTACAYCHGADYRGGPLSTVKAARSFSVEGTTKSYAAGQKVGCYDCHNGPSGD